MLTTRAGLFVLIACTMQTVGNAEASSAVDTVSSTPPLRISRILIENGDVIPPWSSEADLYRYRVVRWTYDVMNALHVKTRTPVIERELLFAVGDTVDPDLLNESERMLRSYPFINEAEIQTVPVDSAHAEVTVRTSDNFSLAPGWISEAGGGSDRTGLLLVEKNLLGWGKEVSAQYEREKNRSRGTTETVWSLEYKDPRLAGSRAAMTVYAARASLGDEVQFAVTQPFATTRTNTAGGFGLYHFSGRARLWRNQLPATELPLSLLSAYATAGRAWGASFRRTKLSATISYSETRHKGTPLLLTGWLPRDTMRVSRRAVETSLTIGRERSHAYHKLRNLDDYDTVEDVEDGISTGLTIGTGFPWEPTSQIYGFSGAFAQASGVSGQHVTVARIQANMRLLEDVGNGRRAWSQGETSAFLHHYYTGLPWQTLAGSINWRSGARMDAPYQLLLGGDTGLRGYAANRFEGNQRLVMNLENRIFTPIRILFYHLGFVIFADAGYVWRPGDTPTPSDLHADFGVGGRIYNGRAAIARVSRFDIAWNLRGQRGFMLSAGSEQMFDLFNRRPTPTRGPAR